MLCLNVSLNGQRLAVAGLSGLGLLGTTVSLATWKPRRGRPSARDGANLSIHGLDMNPRRGRGVHLTWDQRTLTLGDEVLIRVVESETPDRGKVVTDPQEKKRDYRGALKVFLQQRKDMDAEIARLRREIQKRKPSNRTRT